MRNNSINGPDAAVRDLGLYVFKKKVLKEIKNVSLMLVYLEINVSSHFNKEKYSHQISLSV